ncbi:MAG TPA: glycosyltransferase [Acidobacteriaceae bacterium]
MKITILGLTITSSWGNGHATTYRSLCRALHARGHRIDFVEKDVEWYASHRDLASPEYSPVWLYSDWEQDGRELACRLCADADLVVIGSYFPDAIRATRVLLDRVRAPLAFYDIDTPITLAALRASGRTDYLEASLIQAYAAYMSFTGGPVLAELEARFGSPLAAPLYCSVDPALYHRVPSQPGYQADLSYLGTYAADRQAKLMTLLQAPARRLPEQSFLVAGPMYPEETRWAENTRLLSHVPPREHAAFYSSARFTLNLTRQEMVDAGYSPSVRLFEASACGAAIVSDRWTGLDAFLAPGEEIVTVADTEDVVRVLCEMPESERLRMGERARERILSEHTAEHRARDFESIVERMGAKREARAVERVKS